MSVRAVLIILFLPVLAFAGSIEDTYRLELPIQDVRTVVIACGPGSLDVFGVEGADTIKVAATIAVSGITQDMFQDFLDRHVVLSLKERHRRAVVQSGFINAHLMKADAKIDLTVLVPKTIGVKIDDGSGSIFVTDLNTSLEIVDDSGSIEIRKVTGNISVLDGSGIIELADIIGDLEVKDGSGSIQVERVKGNVRVTDASGSITIRDIDGNLTITDGSGSIEINDVTQNVYITEAGSGILEIEGVKGKVITRE
jgi:DUF4097 and DUF4098 domain-containing protein YvlB